MIAAADTYQIKRMYAIPFSFYDTGPSYPSPTSLCLINTEKDQKVCDSLECAAISLLRFVNFFLMETMNVVDAPQSVPTSARPWFGLFQRWLLIVIWAAGAAECNDNIVLSI